MNKYFNIYTDMIKAKEGKRGTKSFLDESEGSETKRLKLSNDRDEDTKHPRTIENISAPENVRFEVVSGPTSLCGAQLFNKPSKCGTSKTKQTSLSDSVFNLSPSKFDTGLITFPEKLMTLLEGNLVKDVMWWLPDGDAFCFIPTVFAEKVLDKHFQGTKFESFTRKLNRWGFKRVAGQKVPINTVAYYHNFFHKDKPDSIKDMSGGKNKVSDLKDKRSITTALASPESGSARSSPQQRPSGVVEVEKIEKPRARGHSIDLVFPQTEITEISGISPALTARSLNGELNRHHSDLVASRKIDAIREASFNMEMELKMRLLRNTPFVTDSDLGSRLLSDNSLMTGWNGSIDNNFPPGFSNILSRLPDSRESPNALISQLMSRRHSIRGLESSDLVQAQLELLNKELAFSSRALGVNTLGRSADVSNGILAQKIALADSAAFANSVLAQQLDAGFNGFNANLSQGILPMELRSSDLLRPFSDSTYARFMAERRSRAEDLLCGTRLLDESRLVGNTSQGDNRLANASLLQQRRLQGAGSALVQNSKSYW